MATWEVVYFKFMPDFADKYAAHMIERAKSSGASQEKIDKATREAKQFKEMYNNPSMKDERRVDVWRGASDRAVRDAAVGRDPTEEICDPVNEWQSNVLPVDSPIEQGRNLRIRVLEVEYDSCRESRCHHQYGLERVCPPGRLRWRSWWSS